MAESAGTSSSSQAGSNNAQFTAPQVSAPKGGGAIQGIGEKFSTGAATGMGSLRIPVAMSPGRSGFDPQLSLTYNSGAGNGSFGMGWSLSTPNITRKTAKGLPRYRDGWRSEDELRDRLTHEDVFLLSGAEDLVPVLDGERLEEEGFRIDLYRPRVEALFARIERWTRCRDGEVHWRSISPANILTVYGNSAQSRISDPTNERHVFSWLIASSYDDRGNAILYEYASENDDGVDLSKTGERNRSRSANRYLKRIFYGNRRPLRGQAPGPDAAWMFEAVLDYGDEGYRETGLDPGDRTVETANEAAETWRARLDPFSTYRSGFEIRTHRLCKRILMFHHFSEELETARCLVRSTEFEYGEKKTGTVLARAIQSGYRRIAEDRYRKKSLPALEMEYSTSPLEVEEPAPFTWHDAEHRNLPVGVDGSNYRWLDLDGEGIPGVLTEQDEGWYYKHNLGHGRFSAMQQVAQKPSLGDLGSGGQQMLDVRGAGRLNLVDLEPDAPGFYERKGKSGWGAFRTFRSFPVLDWNDPNLRFIDVTGDGIADILVTEEEAFRWHPSWLAEGFGPGVRVTAPKDEREGPRVVFADAEKTIYLADLTGDGLSDIVRIRNGEICYWPNLGYGRFGAKITMGGSPRFDQPGQFDQSRIRLTDTDGSGTTDILYLSGKGVQIYLNESGNSWSSARRVEVTTDDATSLSVADFLGRGTACVVWSSSLPTDALRPLRYLDLMRGKKPGLLIRSRNNLGAETEIEYTSSTEFYLADKAAGRPWMTRLPFPVHVVTRVVTYDFVSRNRSVTRSTYHHGYFDGIEREFRGFGRIEQTDTESLDILKSQEEPGQAASNQDEAFNVPPVLTKRWFHTGVFLGGQAVSRHMAEDYYQEPTETSATLLEDTILPRDLSPEETREACRSLKGNVLREEVYALDETEASARPYSVTESNYTVQPLQRRGPNLHAVFFSHARESVSRSYERKLYRIGGQWRADPRTSHGLTLAVDEFGNVLRSVQVAYGRRFADLSDLLSDEDRRKQAQIRITLAEHRYTNAIRNLEMYRNPAPAEAATYELTGMLSGTEKFGRISLFQFEEMKRRVEEISDGRHDLPYDDEAGRSGMGKGPSRREIGRSRQIYRSDDLRVLLPLGRMEARALPGESYGLAFPSGLVAQLYRRGDEDLVPEQRATLGVEGGYRDLDGDGQWWVPSGRVYYSPNAEDDRAEELRCARRHFFLPRRYEDAFGNTMSVRFDAHDIVPVETRDALGSTVTARMDYRVLMPWQVTDVNGNRTEVLYDALGMVAATAVKGKKGQRQGDSLKGVEADLSVQTVLAHLGHPLHDPELILGRATSRFLYDLFAFVRTRGERQPQPTVSYTMTRKTHVSDLRPGEQTKIQHSFAYSDGFGRITQNKVQAEPEAARGGEDGAQHRWAGTGWTIFNNKGKPVRQYEPFFSGTHRFEYGRSVGVSSTMFYDPLGRFVATLHPEHTFAKIVFDPWRQEMWDLSDTVLQRDPAKDPDVGGFLSRLPTGEYQPTWYEARRDGALGRAAMHAAEKSTVHAWTPNIAYLDTLGRLFLTIEENRFERAGSIVQERFATRSELDIQGHPRWITDALGRRICRYDYDLNGTVVHQASRDSGERWILNESTGKPIQAWDSRGQRLRYGYDVLRRQVSYFVQRSPDGPEALAESIRYGEGETEDRKRNLRGKIWRSMDGAGIVGSVEFDFKGNLLAGTRQLLREYRATVDWSRQPALEKQVFTSSTSYDAMNRPIRITTPDGSRVQPGYNEANLLTTMDVALRGADETTRFVRSIRYDARGQREQALLGNGVRTSYAYDPLTYRLAHLETRREHDGKKLQDLSYTYDPVGNVSAIRDEAQDKLYFHNQVVDASNDYVYDAVYRLLSATGREHIGLLRDSDARAHGSEEEDLWRRPQPLPSDGRAMRRFEETFAYDPVGNLLEVVHAASPDRWRRQYSYAESTNRLERTSVGGVEERYETDANGNITRMPHLPKMEWDFKNQLHRTQTRVVREGSAETTYYVYDSGGQRVRKITDRPNGQKAKERIYLGGFEIYREFGGDEVALERETLHVMDDVQRVAMLETKTVDREARGTVLPSTRTRYQFGNHLDSASLELDEDGAVLSYEEFYPYGGTSFQAVRGDVEISVKRYRYLGKERDEETGLYALGARYYAAWLGRWTSADPKGMVDGTNVFAYCRGNPITLRDPNGTDANTSTLEDEAQACLVDPTEPTSREKVLQASLPEDERYLPPQSEKDPQPLNTSVGEAPQQEEQAGPPAANPEQAAYAARVQRYQSVFEEERGRSWWDSTFHLNSSEEREAHQWRAAQDCPECDPTAAPEVIAKQLSNYRWGLGMIGAGNAAMQLSLSMPSPEVEPSQRVPIAAADALENTAARTTLTSVEVNGVGRGLAVATGEGGDSAPMSVVRVIQKGEKIVDIVEEGKALTFETGNEHALVKLANGDRAIVSGGPKGITFAEGEITKLFGHTHPYQFAPTGPSPPDQQALGTLGQRSSWLLEHGVLLRFWGL